MFSLEDESSVSLKLSEILRKKSISAEKLGLAFEREKMPLPVREIFPTYDHYRLELGCGWGEFTREWAAQNPQSLTIATEKKRGRLLNSFGKHTEGKPDNIRYMTLNLEWFFDGVFAPDSFDSVVINFPDPWPRKKHQKHRYFSAHFVNILHAYMKAGGICEFASDNIDYVVYAARNLETSGLFANTLGRGVIVHEIAGRPQSYFEKLWRSKSLPVYFLRYVKN